MEDAKRYAEDMNLEISDEAAGELADIYDERHDCAIADNVVWEQILKDFAHI